MGFVFVTFCWCFDFGDLFRVYTLSAESDLAGFLKEEIAAEKANAKKLVLPGQGFTVKQVINLALIDV